MDGLEKPTPFTTRIATSSSAAIGASASFVFAVKTRHVTAMPVMIIIHIYDVIIPAKASNRSELQILAPNALKSLL